MIELKTKNIADPATRDAVETIRDTYNEQILNLAGFNLFTLTTTGAVTGFEFFHNLGFIPLDIIVTRLTGGDVIWDYDSFTKDKLVLTTSAAVNMRFLAGRLS